MPCLRNRIRQFDTSQLYTFNLYTNTVINIPTGMFEKHVSRKFEWRWEANELSALVPTVIPCGAITWVRQFEPDD